MERTLTSRMRVSCFGILLVALSCNVAVLFIPFINFRQLLSPIDYTIFHTVEMLWGKGLFALSVLVVGFSILFPFFKLAVLFSVVAVKSPGPLLLRLLNRVELLAKWSMLDVFLVCLVLTLTSGQILVGATTKGGVPLFITAIVLSMIVGQLLATRLLDHSSRGKNLRILTLDLSPRARMILVVFSGLTLVGALTLPFLKIESWFLVDDSFSIISVLPALWEQSSYPAVVATALFLIIFPIIRWVVLTNRTWAAWKGREEKRFERLFGLARYWSMLDVFALALAVFLFEGSSFVPTDAEVGAVLLVAVVFIGVTVERLVDTRNEPAKPETVES